MYVVKVIPIRRSTFKEELSFFSKAELPLGSVIDVSIRGKATPALVVGVAEAREEKLSLRGSTYALKKVAPKNIRILFPPSLLEAFKEIATWHAAPLGDVIAQYTPAAVLAGAQSIEEALSATREDETTADVLALQAEFEERMRMYRSLAREAFARGQSLFIVAPTIAEAETLYEKLHRGIENQVLLVSSATTKKASIDAWKRAGRDKEPLLIIGTHSFLTIPRKNMDAIIIERESARAYVSRERGALDTRIAAEAIAKRSASRIIFADFPLRIETRARLERGTMEELSRMQVSVQSRAETRILDAREKKGTEKTSKKKFSVFTDTVRSAVEAEVKRGGRVFLYAARRGLAPLTICNDCGTPITDPASGSPMTLHKTEDGNVFLSFYSGALLPANTSCKVCGSWNLVSLGIGVERVIDEAEKIFKEATIFSLTTDSAPTHAKAKKIQHHFFNTPGAILIGTDRALPYLSEPIEVSAVVSIDSLLSISAWRAHEYAVNTLFYLLSHTQDALYIQTRLPDSPVMHALAHGNPTEFIRNELKEREKFEYPPFSIFIGISWGGTENAVHKTAEIVKDHLKTWDVVGPLPPRQVGKNRYLARAVIRLEPGNWPESHLVATLKSLPPNVAITINPDEIV